MKFTEANFYLSAAPHGEVLMDGIICKGSELQQCYQYLRRVEFDIPLTRFYANPKNPEGSPKDCLPILMKYVQYNIPMYVYTRACVNARRRASQEARY